MLWEGQGQGQGSLLSGVAPSGCTISVQQVQGTEQLLVFKRVKYTIQAFDISFVL